MLTTYILLKVEHSKPIPELTDLAAGRIYTMDKVEDVTAMLVNMPDHMEMIRSVHIGPITLNLVD